MQLADENNAVTRAVTSGEAERAWGEVGGAGPAHLTPRSHGFAARLVASPQASRISRIKPKREPARRL